MTELYNLVDIKMQNEVFLLTPNEDAEQDMIMLGFSGQEKWIRLQCKRRNGDYDYYITIMKNNGKSWGWHWGCNGFTLVSDDVRDLQKQIVSACRRYCRICFEDYPGRGY